MSYDVLALWVYLGAMPLLFVPVIRHLTEGDKVENNDNLTMLCCFVLIGLLVWPIWFVGWMPVLGFAKSVKYVANYERKNTERSS